MAQMIKDVPSQGKQDSHAERLEQRTRGYQKPELLALGHFDGPPLQGFGGTFSEVP